MKPIFVILGLGVVAAGGYFYVQSQNAAEPNVVEQQTAAPAVEETAEEAVNEQVEAVVEETEAAAEEAVETVTEAAESLVDEVTETASEAASDASEAAVEAATEAVEAGASVAEAASAAATAATEAAVESATTAAQAATETAAEVASEAATAVTETATEAAAQTDAGASSALGGMSEYLTLDGFDFDKVIEMINGSELDALKKTMLNTALTKAKDNPELLSGVLDQVKAAMGL